MNLIGTGWIHIESLQPLDWIESQELQLGSTVAPPLDLQEMGLPAELRAEIVEIRSCPEIQDGPGRVVVNTVNHLNPRVLELTIQDADGHTETLRPTETHKFYSATRNTWLSAVELQPGEQLSGLNGPVTLTRITPLPGTHRVYNLTVQGEHLYRVAQSGVLVHNNWCDEIRFGQVRIAEKFRDYGPNPKLAGKTIQQVAAELRRGDLVADDIAVYVFRYKNRWYAESNRGLAALSMAGKKPTNVVPIMNPTQKMTGRVVQMLRAGQQGTLIPVTTFKDGTGVLFHVLLPL